jgi:hypothetical protein
LPRFRRAHQRRNSRGVARRGLAIARSFRIRFGHRIAALPALTSRPLPRGRRTCLERLQALARLAPLARLRLTESSGLNCRLCCRYRRLARPECLQRRLGGSGTALGLCGCGCSGVGSGSKLSRARLSRCSRSSIVPSCAGIQRAFRHNRQGCGRGH